MARKFAICLVLFTALAAVEISAPVSLAASAQTNPSKWSPGEFRGLTAGKSTKADMVRVLGNPDGEPGRASDPTMLLYKYEGKGDLQGRIEVAVRKTDNVIVNISENLPVALPRTPAYKRFGHDYRSVSYSRADCAAKQGIAPLYRDPRGPIEMIEYPERGVALALDQYGYDIASILYLSKPPGAERAPACVARKGSKARPKSTSK